MAGITQNNSASALFSLWSLWKFKMKQRGVSKSLEDSKATCK